MGFRKNIRIDSQREARLLPEPGRALREKFEFLFALDVELQNIGLQSEIHLGLRLANARKHNPGHCRGIDRHDPLQLASGNNVKSTSLPGQ
jgi:hypothetical protein